MFNWLSNRPNKPHPIVEHVFKKFIKREKNKFALDLGCGYGNEVIYLLKQGFYVFAVDSDIQALKITYNKAKNLGLKNSLYVVFGYVPEILESPILRREYDLILCINLLQHLSLNNVSIVLKWMKNHTAHYGLHIISVFVEGSGSCFRTLFKPGDIVNIYKQWKWKILFENSGYFPKHTDVTHPEEELEHYYELLVSQKP